MLLLNEVADNDEGYRQHVLMIINSAVQEVRRGFGWRRSPDLHPAAYAFSA